LFYQDQKEGNYKENSGSCVATRLAARKVPGSFFSPTPKGDYLKSYNQGCGSGSGIEQLRIRDKHPGSTTLAKTMRIK
jgi:hypothetical protein